MRYVIVGAGAIGGGVAARLAMGSPDRPPLLVVRGDNARAIASRGGLRLLTPDGEALVSVETAESAEDARLREDDVLIFATKTQQVESALRDWVDAPVFGRDEDIVGTAGQLLPVFMALNGVESERIALRLFARVFGICVWMPAVHLRPGEFIIRIGPVSGVFIVGRYGVPEDGVDRALLSTLAADWSASTFTVHLVKDVMRWKYAKLISNLSNALQVLLGPDVSSDGVVRRMREEAREIFRAAEIDWASEDEEREWRGDAFTLRRVPGAPPELGGSSWQSVSRGTGSIETDYLNGEIALLARLLGRRAPLNEQIQRLTRDVARGTLARMTVAELSARLES